MFHNIRTGKLESLTCALRTYLFGIGKNILRKHTKREIKHPHIPLDENIDIPGDTEEREERILKEKIAEEAFNEMGESCKLVLSLHFSGKKMKEIAEIMGFKSEAVAKNKKSACWKILREIGIKKSKDAGLNI